MTTLASATPPFGYDSAMVDARANLLGLSLRHGPDGPQLDPDQRGAPVAASFDGIAVPLFDQGLIVAEGPDAVSFLQSQLTNDVEQMSPEQWRRFGFCNAKGRLQAIFTGWRCDVEAVPSVALALPLPMVEVVRKRLSMFVLRAKLRLQAQSDARMTFGLAGGAARAWVARAFGEVPEPGALLRRDGRVVLGLESVDIEARGGRGRGVPRWMLDTPAEEAGLVWRELCQELAPAPDASWRWLSVMSGVPQVFPATWECFVPQMVNLELVGGVSFRKGCYPGQEVVARSQYLGKLKRRMALGHGDGPPPPPGTDLMVDGQTEPGGMVVLSAPSPGGGFHALVESQTAALEGSMLRVGDQPFSVLSLPYPIPAPEPVARR
jgi:folate-binding protein YgfZ